jgi:SagB-type dehydrogenase family enzyme
MSPAFRYPRLCRGLVIVPDGDTLLIDGGPRRRRLTGAAAATVLSDLLRRLDGTSDPAAVAAYAGLDENIVWRLLTALDDCDLLEWPSHAVPAGPGAAPHVVAYFSRTIGTVNGVSCTEELTSALADTAVLLIADDPVADEIAEDLAETGIKDVCVRTAAGLVTAENRIRLTSASRRMVTVLDDGGTALADTVQLMHGSGVPVLRFSGDAGVTEIGPVFCDDWTVCLGCFRSGHPGMPSGVSAAPKPPKVMAALVTDEIIAWLAHTSASARPWRITRVTDSTWRTERFDVTSETGCQACGHAAPPAGASTAAALALAYERHHEIRPVQLSVPRASSRARAHRISALQDERDPLPAAPARDLNEGLSAGSAVIADILARVAGRRKPPGSGRVMDRWAPSGGNLGSVQLYIAAEDDPFNLPGTLFRYDDIGHRILPVRADRVPMDRVLPGCNVSSGPPDLVMVFVASVSRIGRKYDEFALRISHLDAGCAALQLSVAAAARHVSVSFASAWSADLACLLELEPGSEIVTAVAALSRLSRERTVLCR